MKIAISAESTIDLTKELISDNDIKIIPFTIQLGDKSGLDGEITTEEIINFVNNNGKLPKTSAVNEYQYTEHFSKLLNIVCNFSIFCYSSVVSCNFSASLFFLYP